MERNYARFFIQAANESHADFLEKAIDCVEAHPGYKEMTEMKFSKDEACVLIGFILDTEEEYHEKKPPCP